MAILNVTPCKNIVDTGSQAAQVPGTVDTDNAINISSDSTATALPTLFGNKDADYYILVSDGDMYINMGSEAQANAVAIGKTILPTGVPLFVGRGYSSHIGKLDK